MRTAKEETLDLLESLPDDVSLDEIARQQRLRARLLHSREQAAHGELIPNEQVIAELDQWLESLGRPSSPVPRAEGISTYSAENGSARPRT